MTILDMAKTCLNICRACPTKLTTEENLLIRICLTKAECA